MRTSAVTLIAALVILVATGTASAQEAQADATIVHGIPGVPVDVYIDDELALEGFEFGSITESLPLDPGDHDIAVRPAGDQGAEPILDGTAAVEEGTSTSIVAYLDENGEPALGVFANDASLIPAGDARLTVRHAAAAPMVDILVDGEPVLVALSNGDEQTTDIGEGTYSTSFAPAGSTSPILGPVELTLVAGGSSIVYTVGSADDESLELLVQSIDGLAAPPSGIPAGTSGLLGATAFPAWATASLAIAAMVALISIVALRRTRKTPPEAA
jgi:hypothetical protein